MKGLERIGRRRNNCRRRLLSVPLGKGIERGQQVRKIETNFESLNICPAVSKEEPCVASYAESRKDAARGDGASCIGIYAEERIIGY